MADPLTMAKDILKVAEAAGKREGFCRGLKTAQLALKAMIKELEKAETTPSSSEKGTSDGDD